MHSLSSRSRHDLRWIAEWHFAHRGFHQPETDRLENSLAAAQAAMDRGYGIECDIQASRDHRPVVFHDRHLSRLTHDTGLVRHRPLAILQGTQLRTGEPIPTLQDLLTLIDGRVPLLIEIKHDGWRPPNSAHLFVRAIAEAVRRYQGPFALMSFEPAILHALHNVAPDIPRGLVSAGYWTGSNWPSLSFAERLWRRSMQVFEETDADFLAYDYRDLPNTRVRTIRRAGFPVASWTVRTQHEANRISTFCDALIFEKFEPA